MASCTPEEAEGRVRSLLDVGAVRRDGSLHPDVLQLFQSRWEARQKNAPSTSLSASEYLKSLSDDDLMAFLSRVRPDIFGEPQ